MSIIIKGIPKGKNQYFEERLEYNKVYCLYKISEERIAKFKCDKYGNPIEKNNGLKREFWLMKLLEEHDIPHPKQYGFKKIKLEHILNGETLINGIEMEFIKGKYLYELTGTEKEKALKSRTQAIEKAIDKGFCFDDEVKNEKKAIWTPDKKIVLLDFYRWNYVSKK